LHIICKVDKAELKKIPRKGSFIIAFNHINFLEVPLIFVDLLPRKVHGIAKKETWDNPILHWMADCWDTISINRDGFTADTFRKVKSLLKKGSMVVIAPEGTRTGNGRMIQAHPGIISMAVQSKVPIIPIVHFGGELIWDNLKFFKRTSFKYRVGSPVHIVTKEKSHSIRQELVDQLMYRMAKLLPEEYRGYYSQIEKISDDMLKDISFE
jgi:1-acyl-sn-glycerol-3-phosphate acyltransferase